MSFGLELDINQNYISNVTCTYPFSYNINTFKLDNYKTKKKCLWICDPKVEGLVLYSFHRIRCVFNIITVGAHSGLCMNRECGFCHDVFEWRLLDTLYILMIANNILVNSVNQFSLVVPDYLVSKQCFFFGLQNLKFSKSVKWYNIFLNCIPFNLRTLNLVVFISLNVQNKPRSKLYSLKIVNFWNGVPWKLAIGYRSVFFKKKKETSMWLKLA